MAKISAKSSKQQSIPEKLVDAALKLAKTKPWVTITLQEIADNAKVDLADFRDYFEDKTDILVCYGRRIDRKTLASLGKPDLEDSFKDRIFEVLMARFDILNEDRDALLSILEGFKSDPKAALISLPHLKHSMAWMIEAAGVSTSGWKGAGQVLGITLVYMETLRQWMKDESEDMARTMAALDKSLSRYEQLCQYFPSNLS